jgi:prophage DNA circulation protein
MSWTDQLRAASFRGVPFETLGSSFAGGRRTVVHEIPDADRAVTEDTGRKPRAVTFDAFVIGDGAAVRVAALIAALEESGPGRLVHPIHGDLVVMVTDYQQTDAWADGDAVSFALSFVESGDLDFFAPLTIGGGLLSSVDAALSLAQEIFSRLWQVAGLADFVVDSAVDAVAGVLQEIDDVVSGGLGDATEAASIIIDVRDTIEALPDTVEELAASTITDIIARVGDVEALLQLALGAGEEAPTYTGTPSQTAAARNAYQARRLQTRAAVCEAARIVQNADLDDYDTAIGWRDTIATRIQAECDELTEDDADALDVLRDLKTAVVEDVTRRAALLPRATVYTPAAVVSSIALAHRLYADP